MLNRLFVQYFLVNVTCSNAFGGSTGHHPIGWLLASQHKEENRRYSWKASSEAGISTQRPRPSGDIPDIIRAAPEICPGHFWAPPFSPQEFPGSVQQSAHAEKGTEYDVDREGGENRIRFARSRINDVLLGLRRRSGE